MRFINVLLTYLLTIQLKITTYRNAYSHTNYNKHEL